MDSMIGKIVQHRDHPYKIGTVEGFIDGDSLAEREYRNLQEVHKIDNPCVLQNLREFYSNRKFFLLHNVNVGVYVDVEELPKYNTLEKFPLTWRDIGRQR